MLQSHYDFLKHKSGSCLKRRSAVFFDLGNGQFSTFAKLHAQVNVIRLLVSFKVLDYVRVIDMLHNCNFILKAFQILIIQIFLRNFLDGYINSWVFLVISNKDFSK